VQSLAKAGTLSIIGVYPPDAMTFPIGMAMNKNITINMGNCHHRKYIPRLIEMVQARRIDPAKILTQVKPMTDVIAAFEAFDRRENGWIKVELQPQRGDAQGSEEQVLDEAVADTFPASDPTTVQNPR
jgi:threonine dehydrogenase-like Zn-dependent dehydrogenase